MSRQTKFAAESRKFAQACRAEHEALGALLDEAGKAQFNYDLSAPPKNTIGPLLEAARLAHHEVNLQLGVTVAARAKAMGPIAQEGGTIVDGKLVTAEEYKKVKADNEAGHPTTDDDMSRASLGRDAHQAD